MLDKPKHKKQVEHKEHYDALKARWPDALDVDRFRQMIFRLESFRWSSACSSSFYASCVHVLSRRRTNPTSGAGRGFNRPL